MGNGAGEGSDCHVSPTATQSKEFTVTLQNDGRTTSTIKRGAEATCWGLKHFQWYLTILAILVLVAISLASTYIDGVGKNTRSILDELDVKASTVSRVITGVEWVIAATWALAGTTMLGMLRLFVRLSMPYFQNIHVSISFSDRIDSIPQRSFAVLFVKSIPSRKTCFLLR